MISKIGTTQETVLYSAHKQLHNGEEKRAQSKKSDKLLHAGNVESAIAAIGMQFYQGECSPLGRNATTGTVTLLDGVQLFS